MENQKQLIKPLTGILSQTSLGFFNQTNWKIGRVTQLLLLGATMFCANIITYTTGNSLFVNRVGAENFPLGFILVAVCSLPILAYFSNFIDKFSRTKVLRYVLLTSIVIFVVLRLLLELNLQIFNYILLVIIYIQWDIQIEIIYTTLLNDYLTPLEFKRYTPLIGLTQAGAIVVGGSIIALLSRYTTTVNLLLCLPIFFALAIIQVINLENTERKIEIINGEEHSNIIDIIKTFPNIVQRYPLVLLLAASSFIVVIIYTLSEFLWFNVYEEYFSDEALTGFLGALRIFLSITQMGALYGITRTMLKWFGVSRINILYGITSLFSLLTLAFNFNLIAAIILHVNGDPLHKAINQPIHQLNYNAIPKEFIGKLRTLNEGFIRAAGLGSVGIILLVFSNLTLVQITWLGVGLSIILLLIRIPTGKFYAQGLEELIRNDGIELDEFKGYQAQLPSQSKDVVRELLTHNDLYTQIKGLELATRLDNPSQFFPEIEELLDKDNLDIQGSIVKLFSSNPEKEALEKFEKWLETDNLKFKITALLVLIANEYQFSEEQLFSLINYNNEIIAIVAALAITTMDLENPHLETLAQKIWESELEENTAKAIAMITTISGNLDLIPKIIKLIPKSTNQAKKELLNALASLANRGNLEIAEVAVSELKNEDSEVRAAVFNILSITQCKGMLQYVGFGLGDADSNVRQEAAKVLAAYGKEGLSLAKDSLSSSKPEVVQTAILAIGKVRTKEASDILYEYLVPDFQLLIRTKKWQQQIPSNNPVWEVLAIAIEDFHQRLIEKVLYILSCLGYSQTVNKVKRILATDSTNRDNAVEVLVSIASSRFVSPLMPILENPISQIPLKKSFRYNSTWLRTKGYKILLEAFNTNDRWLRTGALIALASIPSSLLQDSDPFVRKVAHEIFPTANSRSLQKTKTMNRILLLKKIALFKTLSLDELFLIDKALVQEAFLAKETIYTENSWSSYLYIIASGKVQLMKTIDQKPRKIRELSVGDYFGEVALFDDAPHWDEAIAISDCTLLKLDKNRFINLITQRPHIILEICRFLSQRLRETDKYGSAL